MEKSDILDELKDKANLNTDDTHLSDIVLLANARTIRKLRKIKNISQGEVALNAEISQSYLSNVEHARHMLSIYKFLSLSFAIDIHPEDSFRVLIDELYYCESAYRNFNDNKGKYESFSDFAKDNLVEDI